MAVEALDQDGMDPEALDQAGLGRHWIRTRMALLVSVHWQAHHGEDSARRVDGVGRSGGRGRPRPGQPDLGRETIFGGSLHGWSGAGCQVCASLEWGGREGVYQWGLRNKSRRVTRKPTAGQS